MHANGITMIASRAREPRPYVRWMRCELRASQTRQIFAQKRVADAEVGFQHHGYAKLHYAPKGMSQVRTQRRRAGNAAASSSNGCTAATGSSQKSKPARARMSI